MNTAELIRTAVRSVVDDRFEAGRVLEAWAIQDATTDILRAVSDIMNDNQMVLYQP